MKITNNISFGKTLVATCQFNMSDRDTSRCKIFELDSTEDKDYFAKLRDNPLWHGNKFLWSMDNLMKEGCIGNSNDTFSLENNEGECLGYISVITHAKPYNKKFIYSLETAPNYSEKKKESTNHIGHSLVAFIIAQAEQENREQVSTLAFDKDTKNFFKRHCGFKTGYESGYDCVLEQKYYFKFLEKYKEKVGNEIKFIA